MTLDLPTGSRGRAVALALAVIAVAAAWIAVASPLLAWHGARAERLTQREALLARMQAVAASLPGLRREAADAAASPDPDALLAGPSDAVAAAALQGQLEAFAMRSGVTLSSIELLPVEEAGAYRRVRLRLAVNGPWPAFVGLLQVIDKASPRMLADDLQLQPTFVLARGAAAAQPLGATLTVVAFRQSDGK